MRLFHIVTFAIAFSFTTQIKAEQPPVYFSLELIGIDASINKSPEFNIAGGAFSFGYEITRFFAFEGRAGLSGSDTDRVDINGTSFTRKSKIDNFASGFLRLNLPDWPAKRIKPYLLVGYTRAKSTVEFRDISTIDGAQYSVSDSESDISYGIGVNLYGHENDGLKFEYIQYFDKDDLEITAYSIGYIHHFN